MTVTEWCRDRHEGQQWHDGIASRLCRTPLWLRALLASGWCRPQVHREGNLSQYGLVVKLLLCPSCSCLPHCRLFSSHSFTLTSTWGVRIAQCLERQTRDQKVAGSGTSRSSGRSFFSRVSFLYYWLLLQYLFHPCVTTVACKRSQSFCRKCRRQVTVKHTCTLCMWLCTKWYDMVHDCMVYTERTKMAAVSHGTSHVTTKQCCKYTTWVAIQNMLYKATVIV